MSVYRLKQQKESEGQNANKPPKKNPNDPAVVLEFAQNAVKKINNIDATAWTSEERESICAALIDLKGKIDTFLNP